VRHSLLALALAALAAPVAATGDLASTQKTPRTVLAIEHGKQTSFLVRLDARSLKRVSKRVPLGGSVCAWASSPNGRRLALAMCVDDVIRIIDARRLRHVAAIRGSNRNRFYTPVLAWPAQRRLVWLGADRVLTADPVTRRRTSTAMLDGALITAVQRVGGTIVLLAAPVGEVGTARLVVVGPDGGLRSVTLRGIRAGTTFDPCSTDGEEWRPGLAVASEQRALVIGAGDEPVAEVDLATMTASYHQPERRRSLLGSQAEAKMGFPGSSRNALWLGDGRLAVWGSDSVRSGPDRVERTPIGLSILDTRDWTAERVQARAEDVALAAGTLLATAEGAGLTAYSLEGRRLYRVFEGESFDIAATFGSRVFLFPGRIRIIDATTGQLLGTRLEVPRILHADFSWW
jgi:hypothetical protein